MKLRIFALLLGLAVLILIGAVGSAWGSVSIPPSAVLQLSWARLTGANAPATIPHTWETILFQIRIPRVILAGLVGLTLAMCGAVYQALFRNPLADPYLIGVSSGASIGATLAIYFIWRFSWSGFNAISIAAFIGALLATAAIYGLARVGGRTPVTTLILAGVALGALLQAGTTFLMFTSKDAFQTMHVLGWLMGSLALSSWAEVRTVIPFLVIGFLIIGFHAHTLNVLQLDEDQAHSLGIPVERVKRILIVAASLAVAAAVSVSGIIGFIGLVIPHIIRLIWGPDHRFLLPMSALFGSIALILADGLARTIFAPRELPLGVVTALVGAPFFLHLLRQQKQEVF
jgi:iron complex transport system permease protein